MATTVGEPKIDHRLEIPYVGIRKRVPMSAMSKNVAKLFAGA